MLFPVEWPDFPSSAAPTTPTWNALRIGGFCLAWGNASNKAPRLHPGGLAFMLSLPSGMVTLGFLPNFNAVIRSCSLLVAFYDTVVHAAFGESAKALLHKYTS